MLNFDRLFDIVNGSTVAWADDFVPKSAALALEAPRCCKKGGKFQGCLSRAYGAGLIEASYYR